MEFRTPTYLTESLNKKWSTILDNPVFPSFRDNYRREVTGVLLENTQSSYLTEAAPYANPTSISTGGISNWEPVLIELVRRIMPNLVAYDICAVQPMNGPVGQIYAMRSQYASTADKSGWTEALFQTIDTTYSGVQTNGTDQVADMFDADGNGNLSTKSTFNPGHALDSYDNTGNVFGYGANTAGDTNAENWGYTDGPAFNQMSFTIDKSTVTAKSRALRADYTIELEQDLKTLRGMSVESELTNILSSEITLELNREILYTAVQAANIGIQNKAKNKGVFDADTDSDGRWSVEKWKGLMFWIESEANALARATRRGKANFLVCTSDVASALAMAQVLDYDSALNRKSELEVDCMGNIFAGTLAGRYKVYIDPYWTGTYDYAVLGYKGASQYDAGIFYCPYVPLQILRSVNPATYQPSVGFKTRYGLVSNPFTSIAAGQNVYYRKFKVQNLI